MKDKSPNWSEMKEERMKGQRDGRKGGGFAAEEEERVMC
jgi:hypothetical protein